MDQRRIIFLGALLLSILAALIYWYGETGNSETSRPTLEQREQAPETVVDEFQQTTFTELGIRQYHMEATKVIHYTRQAAATLAQPTITFFQKPKSADSRILDITDWVAKADEGLIIDNGERLELSGNVEIIKPVDAKDAIEFYTQSLTIKPGQEIAETENPVTIKQDRHITQATGLVIDIAAGKVKLLSQVRSQYVPATP